MNSQVYKSTVAVEKLVVFYTVLPPSNLQHTVSPCILLQISTKTRLKDPKPKNTTAFAPFHVRKSITKNYMKHLAILTDHRFQAGIDYNLQPIIKHNHFI